MRCLVDTSLRQGSLPFTGICVGQGAVYSVQQYIGENCDLTSFGSGRRLLSTKRKQGRGQCLLIVEIIDIDTVCYFLCKFR